MSRLDSDLVVAEVLGEEIPPMGLCASGHLAPSTFRREGPGTKEEPTRFFRVVSRDKGLLGVYCEPCLVVANALARQERRKRRVG